MGKKKMLIVDQQGSVTDWKCHTSGSHLFRSTGLFVFVYSVFYYYKRSNMNGVIQWVQFFGYTILACYIFFLMLGTVSFFASLRFVKYIYRNLKSDWYLDIIDVICN